MRGLSGWRAHYRATERIAFYQWLLRRAEYWHNCRRDRVGRIMAKVMWLRASLLGERMGFSIPRNSFGPGLCLAHVGTVVVNHQAIIGSHCRVYQGVTIGEAKWQAPRIEDFVELDANAVVVGGVSIGRGSRVFPNSVVTRDLPEFVDAAGAPATPVRERVPGPAWRVPHAVDAWNRRYPDQLTSAPAERAAGL